MKNMRTDGKRCFVCGPSNSIGLKLVFRMDDDVCRSEFIPDTMHCGYDGVTHGGIISVSYTHLTLPTICSV